MKIKRIKIPVWDQGWFDKQFPKQWRSNFKPVFTILNMDNLLNCETELAAVEQYFNAMKERVEMMRLRQIQERAALYCHSMTVDKFLKLNPVKGKR
jgi:hypothetical protein